MSETEDFINTLSDSSPITTNRSDIDAFKTRINLIMKDLFITRTSLSDSIGMDKIVLSRILQCKKPVSYHILPQFAMIPEILKINKLSLYDNCKSLGLITEKQHYYLTHPLQEIHDTTDNLDHMTLDATIPYRGGIRSKSKSDIAVLQSIFKIGMANAGLSQTTLGERLNISQSYLSRILNCKRSLSIPMLPIFRDIIDILNLDAECVYEYSIKVGQLTSYGVHYLKNFSGNTVKETNASEPISLNHITRMDLDVGADSDEIVSLSAPRYTDSIRELLRDRVSDNFINFILRIIDNEVIRNRNDDS